MNKRKISLKWFGSITNLSFRRTSDPNKVSSGEESAGVCRTHTSPALLAPLAASVDDMESNLHSPGYARSCDMYTHVGTVPRRESSRRSTRRERKTGREEGTEGGAGGQSEVWAGDCVRDSPLLSSLSSLAGANCTSLPATREPSNASPLTPEPDGLSARLAGGSMRSQDASPGGVAALPGGFKAASPQDLYVPMDPVYEDARGRGGKQETTGGAQAVEANRKRGETDSGGEYVKFSKEKFWLEPPTDELKKQLEEELKLSSSNLRSHGWYHGDISEEVSESLVLTHGDFLVRDSSSGHGDFVLTSRWNHNTYHFLVQKTATRPGEASSHVQYRLEGEAFDSVPALVHFYVGSRAVLTKQTQAQIHCPVNRTLPLGCRGAAGVIGPESSSSSPHHKVNDQLPPPHDEGLSEASSSALRSRPPCICQAASMSPSPSLLGLSDAATSSLSPNSQCKASLQPPPGWDSATSDMDGSCYTELYPGTQSYVERLRVEEESVGGSQLRVEDAGIYVSPVVETVSSFWPSKYQSPLMPKENKPLEVGILRRVKELLAEVDPKTAAKHITHSDCVTARILDVTPEVQRMMGVSSGMELLTLPHGHQLRLDLLERFQTMATMLAVNVLGCTGTTEERASLLHKIIQIAAELKSNMGNMFGFAAIMRALELPQVTRLEQTWTTLRQRHTEGAVLYEKTLRPFMKGLNEGRESFPLSSTTFPHILPLLSLLEKSVAVGDGAEPWETVEAGVDVVMFHLGAARTVAQLGGVYRANAENQLQGFEEDAAVSELFHTEFQMRLLWGSRGAKESPALRYDKFDQVLTALSNRLEPSLRTP